MPTVSVIPSALSVSILPAPGSLPEQAFQLAIHQADLAISITDPQANILFANDTFCQLTGYQRHEVVGRNESVLSSKTTPRDLYQRMWATLSAQRPWSGRLLNQRKDGSTYLAELHISPIVDRQGQISHFLGMHRDITHLNNLEIEVKGQKALIESVIDTTPMALIYLDLQGRILLDNQEYKKLVSDLGTREPLHLLLEEALPGWMNALHESPERCVLNKREVRIDRPQKRPRWFSINTRLIQPDESFPMPPPLSLHGGWLVIISDITDLHEEQEKARAAGLQAVMAEEERMSAIREGLSAAAFRLEEPINVMSSALSLLRRREPATAEMLQDALNTSREHLQHLREIIPPHSHEQPSVVNMNEVLRDVLEINTPKLLAAGVVVDWKPASTLPGMMGRPIQLRMLFKALIDNAIEAMNTKGWNQRELYVTTRVENDLLQVDITDTGPGIPQEWRQKAFEPFFTAKGRSGRHIGTGLPRAQHIVSDHGGILDLESAPGGGCLAHVEFRINGDPI